jgi:hypothetical protein
MRRGQVPLEHPGMCSRDGRTTKPAGEIGALCGARVSRNRRRQRSELRPHPKEEAMSHPLAVVLRDARWASATGGG